MKYELEVAVSLAREAGSLLLQSRAEGLEVQFKGVNDPVTQADIAADSLIRTRLALAFPHDGLLSEETADHPARLGCERVWIVDPIDGTSNYARGGDHFAVSIGLAVGGQAMLGVVYNPATAELFAGAVGLGLSFNERPAETSHAGQVATANLLVSASEWRAGLNALPLPIKPISSIAYKLGLVAAGFADGTFTANARYEWDVCAGTALVAAAGGMASLRDGKALRFNQPNPRLPWGILASGQALYGPLLEALRELPTAAWAAAQRHR